MTNMSRGRFQPLLQSLAANPVDTSTLPVDDRDFWIAVFALAGQHHISGVASGMMDRLLASTASEPASVARRSAAIAALMDGDMHVRRRAMHFLSSEASTPEVVAAASRAVRDPDLEVGTAAVRLISHQGSQEVIDVLVQVLTEARDARETMAAAALAERPDDAIPGLTLMLGHADADVRWRATRCLTTIAISGHQRTLEPLVQAFHDDSPGVARVAADGLVALGTPASIPVLRSVLRVPLTEATAQALHSYALHATPASVFQPLARATLGSAIRPSTLLAVDKALATLESSP